jgi:putrescine transport system substrate-binding protein
MLFSYGRVAALLAAVCGVLMIMSLTKKQCVNIYDWYGVLPRSVISKFESETGISVNYDVFDNNEILEAKLLTSNSGYDVVFPTVVPYAARQLKMGIYQKMKKSLLPHLGDIEPILLEKMQDVDSSLDFLLPYYWGTTGIAFDEDVLENVIPDVSKDGNHLLFDLDIAKKLQPFGISFLQEPVDVFPVFFEYSKMSCHNKSLEELWRASQKLFLVCENVKRFSSARFVTDLIAGDICIAQAWSGEALKAIYEAKKIGRHIKYILPKDGTFIWIDAIAIPMGAPNVENAHKFIDFLLRPEISAEITDYAKMATMVSASKKYLSKEVLENKLIFPPDDILKRLCMLKISNTPEEELYERVRMRIWTQMKMQVPMNYESFKKLCQKQEARLCAAGSSLLQRTNGTTIQNHKMVVQHGTLLRSRAQGRIRHAARAGHRAMN